MKKTKTGVLGGWLDWVVGWLDCVFGGWVLVRWLGVGSGVVLVVGLGCWVGGCG